MEETIVFVGVNSLQCQVAANYYLQSEIQVEKLVKEKKMRENHLHYIGRKNSGEQVYIFTAKKDYQLIPKILASLQEMYKFTDHWQVIEVKNPETLTSFTIWLVERVQNPQWRIKLSNYLQERFALNLTKVN